MSHVVPTGRTDMCVFTVGQAMFGKEGSICQQQKIMCASTRFRSRHIESDQNGYLFVAALMFLPAAAASHETVTTETVTVKDIRGVFGGKYL